MGGALGSPTSIGGPRVSPSGAVHGEGRRVNDSEAGVRYPECEVELSGVDGNAIVIFRTVRKALIKHLEAQGWDHRAAVREGDAFQAEATSGDYDHVLDTCHRWVTVY